LTEEDRERERENDQTGYFQGNLGILGACVGVYVQ